MISQIYGGGGNSGATFKNDFIELFNPGGSAVSVAGRSVQYASAAGTTWQVTNLSGSIQPGAYYLVQESQGAGGTTALPTPDATGTIAMSGTDGKIALVQATTALTGACPSGMLDQVSYGSGNCGSAALALSNTTSDSRNDSGCACTANPTNDFTKGAVNPRNAASPVHACPGSLPLGPLDHASIGGPTTFTLTTGSGAQLVATPRTRTTRRRRRLSPATR